MLLLKRADIESIYTMKDAIKAVKRSYSLASAGKAVVPLRTSLINKEADGTFCLCRPMRRKRAKIP